MQAPVEVRYAGIVVGRAQEVRSDDDPSTFFLPGKDPMPVGTVLQLRSGDTETPARVLRAIESSDPAVAGMKVRLIGEAEAVASDWVPAPATAPAKAPNKSTTPTPAVEVDLGLMQTEMPMPPALLDVVKLSAAPEPVPQAVPVAVASSLTGALEKATESVAPAAAKSDDAPAAAAKSDAEPAAAKTDDEPATAKSDDKDTQETPALPAEAAPAVVPDPAAPIASAEEAASNGADGGAAPATEEMPVARPISGPSGRRKTKRRR